jgi:hypothetical protein
LRFSRLGRTTALLFLSLTKIGRENDNFLPKMQLYLQGVTAQSVVWQKSSRDEKNYLKIDFGEPIIEVEFVAKFVSRMRERQVYHERHHNLSEFGGAISVVKRH